MRTFDASSPRFFNPLMVWADVAVKTGEMLVSSSSVIQMRTRRMAEHGLQPTPADMREIHLMSEEKLAAAAESGAAVANQLHTVTPALMIRLVQEWLHTGTALMSLATSFTPVQAFSRAQALFDAGTRVAATLTQLSSAGAWVAQRAIQPIHTKVTSNVRRLAQPSAFRLAPAAAA